jgi:hypothetical protein
MLASPALVPVPHVAVRIPNHWPGADLAHHPSRVKGAGD